MSNIFTTCHCVCSPPQRTTNLYPKIDQVLQRLEFIYPFDVGFTVYSDSVAWFSLTKCVKSAIVSGFRSMPG